MKKLFAGVAWPVWAMVGLALVVIIIQSGLVSTYEHFVWLAGSFLAGRMDILPADVATVGFTDLVYFDGKLFYPLGPLPALLLVPAVATFGRAAWFQPLLASACSVGVLLVCYYLARAKGFVAKDSVWLAAVFVFGSVAIGCLLTNFHWQIGNALAALMLLLALLVYFQKRSLWLVGMFVGLAALSRLTAGLGILFFLAMELKENKNAIGYVRRTSKMIAPCVAALLLLAAYNFARFGNIFNTGHSEHYLYPGDISDRLSQGVFGIRNIGRNIYYYFLKLPEWVNGRLAINPNGLSFFILSPFFIYAFLARRVRSFFPALIVTAPALIVFMTYFTTGYSQFGPRYLLDILPFWFVVLLEYFRSVNGLKIHHRIFIAASAALNLTLFIVYIK